MLDDGSSNRFYATLVEAAPMKRAWVAEIEEDEEISAEALHGQALKTQLPLQTTLVAIPLASVLLSLMRKRR